MAITMQQQRVTLRCGYNLVSFDWPVGSDAVTISQSERPESTELYSIEEAHELFDKLLRSGAY
jgi:hypothetical protein